jgi:hypothetical protein
MQHWTRDDRPGREESGTARGSRPRPDPEEKEPRGPALKGLADNRNLRPDLIIQAGAYPNPFSENLVINVRFNQTTTAKIVIYNMIGEKISQIADGIFVTDQTYSYTWQQDHTIPQGIYVVNITTPQGSKQFRVVLVR